MLRILLISIFMLSSAAAWAERDSSDPYTDYRERSDYDERFEVPWVEIETLVKKPPEDDNLTRIELDTLPPGLELYADIATMTLDERDLVLRGWFVVRSSRGAYNGSFEGFRCSNSTYKVYAYANPRRSKPLRVIDLPRWREVRERDYRHELTRYLCDGTLPREPDQVRASLDVDSTDYDAPY